MSTLDPRYGMVIVAEIQFKIARKGFACEHFLFSHPKAVLYVLMRPCYVALGQLLTNDLLTLGLTDGPLTYGLLFPYRCLVLSLELGDRQFEIQS